MSVRPCDLTSRDAQCNVPPRAPAVLLYLLANFACGRLPIRKMSPTFDYIFRFFPSMRSLSLSAGTLLFNEGQYDENVVAGLARLIYLDLCFSGSCNARLLKVFPAAHDVPEILVVSPNQDAVYAALHPLRSPFHLLLQGLHPVEMAEFRFTFWSPSSGHIRHFAEAWHNYAPGDPDGPNPIFGDVEFFYQLASLTISTSVWAVVHAALPSFASLQELTVLIDYASCRDIELPQQPLPLPCLVTVTLTSIGDLVYVAVHDIAHFVQRTTSNPINLRLDQVVVQGDLRCCQGLLRLLKLSTGTSSGTFTCDDSLAREFNVHVHVEHHPAKGICLHTHQLKRRDQPHSRVHRELAHVTTLIEV